MRFIGTVLVVTALALSATGLLASAKSFDELMRLAGQDTLPEVRQAAALALTPQLVTSQMSNDDLHQLAQSGPSAELRSAAARALGERLVQAASGLEQLEALTASGDFPEVREVAGQALSQSFLQSSISLDSLVQIAVTGASPELRAAVIPALTEALINSNRSLSDLSTTANSAATTEYRLAAAQALVSRMSSSPLFNLDQPALLDISAGKPVSLAEQAQGTNTQMRAAAASIFQEQLSQADWNLNTLEALAGDPNKAPELRAAAGAVLSDELLQFNMPLSDLENIAKGTTPELRAAAHPALVQALVGAVGEQAMDLAGLVAYVATAPSEELAEAAAEAVFVLLRSDLVAPDAQSEMEAIANGKSATVESVTLDGSLQAFRVAASDFLAGIYTFYGFIDRLSDPLNQLTAIAGDKTLTREFRAAAGEALVPVYTAQRGRAIQDLATLNGLLDQFTKEAIQGQSSQALDTLTRFRQFLDAERSLLIVTAEVGGEFTVSQLLNDDVNLHVNLIEDALKSGELLTISSEISGIQRDFRTISGGIARAPDVSDAALEQIAAQGATPELRQAASQALAQRFLQDSPGQTMLEQLARTGTSAEFREAAVPALAAAYIAAGTTFDRLYGWALKGETDALRAAAAQAFIHALAGPNSPMKDLESLANGETIALGDLAIDGSKTEVRQAFGQALKKAFVADSQTGSDLLTWAIQGATPELRQAAAGAWAQRTDGAAKLTIDQLISITASGQSEELRQAAAEVLAPHLIGSKLTESDLMALASMHTRAFGSVAGTSAELSQALAEALADRFAHES
jgi:hypothetical protein